MMGLRPIRCYGRRVFRNGSIFRRPSSMIQLAVYKMAVNFLWRIKAGTIRCCSGVKCNFDPVITPSIPLGLAVGICRKVRADHHVTATEHLRVSIGRTWIATRIILTDHSLRYALIFIDDLPFRLLVLVAVENAFCGNHIHVFP